MKALAIRTRRRHLDRLVHNAHGIELVGESLRRARGKGCYQKKSRARRTARYKFLLRRKRSCWRASASKSTAMNSRDCLSSDARKSPVLLKALSATI
jgi:hypothetical protein